MATVAAAVSSSTAAGVAIAQTSTGKNSKLLAASILHSHSLSLVNSFNVMQHSCWWSELSWLNCHCFVASFLI